MGCGPGWERWRMAGGGWPSASRTGARPSHCPMCATSLCANPFSPVHPRRNPSPSGPRWAWRSVMRCRTAGSTGVPWRLRRPVMPHMLVCCLDRRPAPPEHEDARDAPAHRLLPAVAALCEIAHPGEPPVAAAYPAVLRDVELGPELGLEVPEPHEVEGLATRGHRARHDGPGEELGGPEPPVRRPVGPRPQQQLPVV